MAGLRERRGGRGRPLFTTSPRKPVAPVPPQASLGSQGAASRRVPPSSSSAPSPASPTPSTSRAARRWGRSLRPHRLSVPRLPPDLLCQRASGGRFPLELLRRSTLQTRSSPPEPRTFSPLCPYPEGGEADVPPAAEPAQAPKSGGAPLLLSLLSPLGAGRARCTHAGSLATRLHLPARPAPAPRSLLPRVFSCT